MLICPSVKTLDKRYVMEIMIKIKFGHNVTLGCLYPVACVRSGDGVFLSVYATSLS
jgi:hypothetical protein